MPAFADEPDLARLPPDEFWIDAGISKRRVTRGHGLQRRDVVGQGDLVGDDAELSADSAISRATFNNPTRGPCRRPPLTPAREQLVTATLI